MERSETVPLFLKGVLCLCCAFHTAFPQSVLGQEVFFNGLDLRVSALALRSQYPASRHVFWPSDGGRSLSPRRNEEFEQALLERSGRYLIRLNQEESFEDVYLVDIRLEEGTVTEIHLSFEKPVSYLESQPADWEASHYARYPDCDAVEAKIKDRFGEPSLKGEWSEEQLLHQPKSWSLPGQTIELDCYSLDGDGKPLAAEVIFARE